MKVQRRSVVHLEINTFVLVLIQWKSEFRMPPLLPLPLRFFESEKSRDIYSAGSLQWVSVFEVRLPGVFIWKDPFSSSLHRAVILLLHLKSDSTCHVIGKEGVPRVKEKHFFHSQKMVNKQHLDENFFVCSSQFPRPNEPGFFMRCQSWKLSPLTLIQNWWGWV